MRSCSTTNICDVKSHDFLLPTESLLRTADEAVEAADAMEGKGTVYLRIDTDGLTVEQVAAAVGWPGPERMRGLASQVTGS